MIGRLIRLVTCLSRLVKHNVLFSKVTNFVRLMKQALSAVPEITSTCFFEVHKKVDSLYLSKESFH